MAYKKSTLKQGFFHPVYPEKYKGDLKNIVFRSGLELKWFNFCDLSPNILKWSSEEVVVVYHNPIDNKMHRYFLDLWIKTKDDEFIAEIKPYKYTVPPKKPKRITKSHQQIVKNWVVYSAKLKYAKQFASEHNMKFVVLTEKDLK